MPWQCHASKNNNQIVTGHPLPHSKEGCNAAVREDTYMVAHSGTILHCVQRKLQSDAMRECAQAIMQSHVVLKESCV